MERLFVSRLRRTCGRHTCGERVCAPVAARAIFLFSHCAHCRGEIRVNANSGTYFLGDLRSNSPNERKVAKTFFAVRPAGGDSCFARTPRVGITNSRKHAGGLKGPAFCTLWVQNRVFPFYFLPHPGWASLPPAAAKTHRRVPRQIRRQPAWLAARRYEFVLILVCPPGAGETPGKSARLRPSNGFCLFLWPGRKIAFLIQLIAGCYPAHRCKSLPIREERRKRQVFE